MPVNPIFRKEIIRRLNSIATSALKLAKDAETLESLSGKPLEAFGSGLEELESEASALIRHVNFLAGSTRKTVQP